MRTLKVQQSQVSENNTGRFAYLHTNMFVVRAEGGRVGTEAEWRHMGTNRSCIFQLEAKKYKRVWKMSGEFYYFSLLILFN